MSLAPPPPPGPLETNILPVAIGVVVGLVITLEFRRQQRTNWWLRGAGFGVLVVVVSVFSLPVGVVFGAVVVGLVRR